MKLIKVLKNIVEGNSKTNSKTDNKSFETNKKKYLTVFEEFKEYLGEPSDQYNKWVKNFEENKKPYTDYDEYQDKKYHREHYLDWWENFGSAYRLVGKYHPVVFDKRKHNDYLEEYQQLKAEHANELDNPHWMIESSDVLTMFSDIKDLTELLKHTELKKNLGMVVQLINSLTKLMYGNDEVRGWFYTPEGVVDFLYFLNYSFKNYY